MRWGKVKARLVIVGRDATHPYTKKLIDLARGKAIVLGPQPFRPDAGAARHSRHRRAAADAEPKSRGYVPCKIYEAMAMAIPVIASDLCDIPLILDGCGYVVPPEDSGALQATIEHVLAHPEEAREMGRRARRRVIERYSWEVMDRILHDAILSTRARRLTRPVTSMSGATRRRMS